MGLTNELIVRGEPQMIDDMIQYIEAYPSEAWKYEPNDRRPMSRLEDRADRAALEKDFHFSWTGDDKTPPAILTLRKIRPGCLILSELRASGPEPLSYIQFNSILYRFYRDILRKAEAELSVGASLLPPYDQWERDLPRETGRRLRAFSDAANKKDVDGSDWQRWDAFVIQAHRDEAVVRENLEGWLIRKGWDEDRCAELLGRYELAAHLLYEYDEVRTQA